ncbi:MAG: hypothetical protein R3F61_09925 [Myxococcota bacterium]
MSAPEQNPEAKLNRAQRRNQKRREARDREALAKQGPRAPRPDVGGTRRYNASSRHRGKN